MMENFQTLFDAVGPWAVLVLVVLASFWFIKYMYDANDRRIEAITNSHEAEVKELRELFNSTIVANTDAITELTAYIKTLTKE